MNDNADDGFELDLRDHEPRRRTPGLGYPLGNGAKLSHWQRVTAPCAIYASEADDREGCRARRWAEHIRLCASCAEANAELRWAEVVAFAEATRAEREVLRS